MIRLVEGTSSATDKLLVPALVARDTILGPVTAWCPWWWRSASSIPELRTHVPQPQPARWAPRASRSAATQHDMRNIETHDTLQQANAFIAAEEEYLPLPQMDGTDETSADPQSDALSSITTLRRQMCLLWLPGTLPWQGVQRLMARCAHVNPLRPFCDSTKFPQNPAATRIAVTGAAACARMTLWATRVAQSKIACWEKEGRPVPGANLQEIQANLVELAAWRQIAQDPAGFAASLQVCPRAAADLATTLREQLQMDRSPSSVQIGCAADNQRLKAISVPEKQAMWSFHALYESSVCLSPNDSRLHEALQKPTLGGYDPPHSK